MLSSETTDIDCYSFSFRNEKLELRFLRTFPDTPFFFFTHGDRLIVDGNVFSLE